MALFFYKPRTEAAKVNVKELYWSLSALAMCSLLTHSSPIQANELWRGRCYVSWMASPVGNNSTEFQISEYVSLILSFLGMRSTPGVFIYTWVPEN